MNFRSFFFILSGIIGSGIFFTPYDLQFLNVNAFISLIFMSFLFIYIGYLFSTIKSESIFSFISENLGINIGFFTAWLYWVISWGTTIVVVGEIFRYLVKIIPSIEIHETIVKMSLVLFFILFNCIKNRFKNLIEMSINVTKIIPLIIFPFICIFMSKFKIHNLVGTINTQLILKGFPQILWCFFGLECCAIVNKGKNISKVTILGIASVFLIYFLNLISIFGIMGYKLPSYTPYADLMEILFGHSGKMIFSIIVLIITIGTLNVWITSSAEVAVDSSKLGYFPKFLQKKTESGVNYIAVIMSSIGLIPMCAFESNNILRKGVSIAGNGILVFYLIFCIAYFKKYRKFLVLLTVLICLGFLINISSFNDIYLFLCICIFGIPFFINFKKNQKIIK